MVALLGLLFFGSGLLQLTVHLVLYNGKAVTSTGCCYMFCRRHGGYIGLLWQVLTEIYTKMKERRVIMAFSQNLPCSHTRGHSHPITRHTIHTNKYSKRISSSRECLPKITESAFHCPPFFLNTEDWV